MGFFERFSTNHLQEESYKNIFYLFIGNIFTVYKSIFENLVQALEGGPIKYSIRLFFVGSQISIFICFIRNIFTVYKKYFRELGSVPLRGDQ